MYYCIIYSELFSYIVYMKYGSSNDIILHSYILWSELVCQGHGKHVKGSLGRAVTRMVWHHALSGDARHVDDGTRTATCNYSTRHYLQNHKIALRMQLAIHVWFLYEKILQFDTCVYAFS